MLVLDQLGFCLCVWQQPSRSLHHDASFFCTDICHLSSVKYAESDAQAARHRRLHVQYRIAHSPSTRLPFAYLQRPSVQKLARQAHRVCIHRTTTRRLHPAQKRIHQAREKSWTQRYASVIFIYHVVRLLATRRLATASYARRRYKALAAARHAHVARPHTIPPPRDESAGIIHCNHESLLRGSLYDCNHVTASSSLINYQASILCMTLHSNDTDLTS